MDKILTLLDLQKQAASAQDIAAFEFIALNQSNALIPYKQAVFWHKTDFGIALRGVSGNMSLDRDGSYAQFLKSFIKQQNHKTGEIVTVFSHKTLPEAQKAEWKEYIGAHAALLTFQNEQDGVLGGLWLERDKAFNEGEQGILGELAAAYTPAYALLNLRKKSAMLSPWKQLKKHQKIILAACALLCFLPVRLSVTAPAEIIAQSPIVMTVPYDGVLEKISVKPGEAVKDGQTLFTMDQTDLDSKIEAAGQALRTAEKNLSRTRRESLSAPEKKAEITRLRSEIAEKKIEYEHAKTLLDKSVIRASNNGIAIFSDADEFEGQPLRTGEKVMIVANPQDSELLIKVPVDNMLAITQDSPVRFYLNVSPLKGHSADIISMGYQAGPDTDGLLTYKIRAQIKGENNARIGWKGTAKIKGDWSILAYSILRRPIISLRKVTGL